MTLFALLLACTGADPKDSGDTDVPTTETGRDTDTTPIVWPNPTLVILSPTATSGPEVTIELQIDGLILSEYIPPTTLRSAHVDGEPPKGFPIVRLDGAEVASGPETTFILPDVAIGPHLLEVEAVWFDRDAFFPPVLDAVQLTVE